MKYSLFDIDGVLADDRHRVPFYLAGDFDAYFSPELVTVDGVWEQGKNLLLSEVAKGNKIGYLTGRRDVMRSVTRGWLDKHGFPPGPLLMKTPAFYSYRLAEFKVEALKSLGVSPASSEFVLFEDDPEVVKSVKAVYGEDSVVHCTWSIKDPGMVKDATV